MEKTVHARLDPESRRALEKVRRRLGWSESKAIREGLRLLAATHALDHASKIVGIGAFSSGVPDLGSNKEHLRAFGT
jgi:hypothetical protein